MCHKLFSPCVILLLCTALSSLQTTEGANILFFFGVSTYSHRIVVWPLVEALADRGHNVTFVQPFPPKKPHPKVTEFYPQKGPEFSAEGIDPIDFLNARLKGGRDATLALATQLPSMGLSLCEAFLDMDETKEWVKKSKFDLVVIDGLYNDCGFGLALKFKAKTILFGTTHPFTWIYDSFGIIPESSWTPEIHLSYQYPMSFYERLVSTLLPLAIHYQKQNSYYPALSKVFERTLDLPEAPDVAELEQQTSLVFTNTHYSEELARSLPPLVVSVGGIHCEDNSQSLANNKELEKFINDSGSTGFIYVSFGSAARISEAPKEFQTMFYNALRSSKLKFVWKFEGERTPEIPENVFVAKWMPQQAILAHPNIKAFLTHGGLLGMQEAIWHAVPLITIPIFAEQDYNAFRVQRTQRGVMLDPNKLTQQKLEDAFRTVATDPKYKKNMQDLSKRFKDRPERPVDKAVWWTEYVLRNDDLSSMKPLSIHQTWYQRRLLDVWGFVFSVLTTVIILVAFVIKKVLNVILAKNKPTNQKKLKTK